MATKNRWLVPTNTINMRMIIAQGLISSPDGFKKYYIDALELYPGYIPIYKNIVPRDILEKGVSERDSLTSCIMEFDISRINGNVKVFKGDELVSINIVDIEKENVDMIFLLAPLPLSCISQILFKSNDDKKQFEEDAQNRSNVVLSGFVLQSRQMDQKLFNPISLTSPLLRKDISNVQTNIETVNYNEVYALGGMMASMFFYAKNGTVSNNVLLACLSEVNPSNDSENYSIILNYFYTSVSTLSETDATQVTYKKLIDAAVNRKDFKEAVIEFLEPYAPTFAQKLQYFESRSDKPVSEEFHDAKTLLQKCMLMLFLREDTESLIDYSLDLFTETDYIVFAMLFGIRDKFIKIPKFIREYKDLQHFISTKMANHAHKMINSQIEFKESKQPLTIIDMLKNNRFKEYLAKELKIENCFETTISKSDFLIVKGKPVFKGIVMPKFNLLEDEYFEFISKYKLTEYNKFLQKYEKVK